MDYDILDWAGFILRWLQEIAIAGKTLAIEAPQGEWIWPNGIWLIFPSDFWGAVAVGVINPMGFVTTLLPTIFR